MDRITIIGMGLIGSSLARRLTEKRLFKTVVAADHNIDVCQKVRDLGFADEVTDTLEKSVEGADMVVLAVPVGAMGKVMQRIASNLKTGVVISDTGSVKQAVVDMIKPYCRRGIEFVPAHPIAGTEFSGPESGFSTLFEGRWCVLSPLPDVSVQAVEAVTRLWESCGSMVEIMDIKHHDLVLGITSHLPHLIAYTIVGTANDLEDDIKSEVIKFSASGFRDFTRIAASDPTMWRDVFLNNKDAVLEILQRFNEDLTAMQRAIRKGDGDYLYRCFGDTRSIRQAIVEIGQA
ncbi:MAG: prephenate/arogenate dehydrogenase family protein [Alphaproteobacteria bacterium]